MLSESLGNTYCSQISFTDSRECWWGDDTTARKSFLTSDKPMWGQNELKKLTVWIRPQDCDTRLSCPPLVNSSLVIDEGDVPLTRVPDATIPFTCAEEWLVVKGPSYPKGLVTCTVNPGQTPQWVPDECELECPSNYTLSQDETACFKFTTETGHGMDAVDRCVEEGAYLPYITNPDDLLGDTNVTYYIANVVKTDQSIYPAINASTYGDLGYTAINDTSNTAISDCILLASPLLYNVIHCKTLANIACMLPTRCPEEYRLVEGRCFRLMQTTTPEDFLDNLYTCNAEGSALAYPQTEATIKGLTKMAMEEINWGNFTEPVNIALGLNLNFEGENLTANGLYAPDNDVTRIVQTSGLTSNNYTFLTIEASSLTWSLTPTSTNSSTQHFFCEFHGPIGDCNPGYFMGAELGNKTPQYIKCKGQLGGWVMPDTEEPILSLIPCIGVIACNETVAEPPMGPDYMTIWYEDNYRFETKSFYYVCKKRGMRTEIGEKYQRFRCTEYNGTYAYDRENVSECTRCYNSPDESKFNIKINWTDATYLIDDQLNAICKPGHKTDKLMDTQTMNCTADGWQVHQCHKACLEEPNVTLATTDWMSGVLWAEKSTVIATCHNNSLFIEAQSQTRAVKCVDKKWEVEPGCQKVCSGSPTVSNATVKLLNRVWSVGEHAQVTCIPEHRFEAEASDEAKVECIADGWENRQGCVKVCLDQAKAESAQTNWNASAVYPVGANVTATCLPNYALIPSNDTTHQLECQADGWYAENECKLLCLEAPQVDNATTDWDETMAWGEGDFVNVTCNEDYHFINMNKWKSVECSGGEWKNALGCQEAVVVPACQPEPTIFNAQTDWTSNKLWRYGNHLTATCDDIFYFKSTLNNSTEVYHKKRDVECFMTGWENVGQCDGVLGIKCNNDAPTVTTSNTVLTHTWTGTFTYMVDETITYTCIDSHLHLPDGNSVSTVRCDFEGWAETTGCEKVCMDEPSVEGGDTNWDSGKVWPVGSIVNITCESDLRLMPDGNQTQQIQCTDQGWETGGPCQTVCMGEPNFGNLSLVWPSSGAWGVNQNQTAPCPLGYLTNDYSENATYTCTASGWSSLTTCHKACIEIPALVNAAGETWDEDTWIVGDTVNISCPYSHLTPQGSTNVTHGCTDDGWANSSYCIKVCLPPTGLPENMTWPEGVHEVGSVMTVFCPETYLTRDANDNSTYSCTDSGWHTPQPCIKVCLTEPEVNNSITAFDHKEMWADGDKMKVWCLPEHQVRPGVTYYTISCTSTGWQEDHPQCLIDKRLTYFFPTVFHLPPETHIASPFLNFLSY
ncbi:hypothetical protein Pmani_012394 [Petrolisthes manimaculis]|uniref:Sushi domain-containing protein n=1 Tax=Petrolisthes manimaculis TaxID=1843537 RepID=A0AAE1PY43_9EUCA|nr:hypothetical protein Pmani_012394 [Petrolisthes manimaculis]